VLWGTGLYVTMLQQCKLSSCAVTSPLAQVVETWHGAPSAAAVTVPAAAPTGSQRLLHPRQAQQAQRAQLVSPAAGACVAQALASHPTQPCVATGSAPGYIHLWAPGDAALLATYAPLPFSHSLVDAPSGAVPQPQQVAHWRYATDIAFNAAGTRFAAIGKGGWVCMWRYDAQWADTAHGRVGCCDWSHHCIARHGDALAFVGGTSSQLLVGGCSAGAHDLSLWDVLMPLPRACVAAAPAHLVNDVAVAGDEVTVVVASKTGAVEAYDLRQLGPCRVDARAGAAQRARQRGVVWRHERAHAGGATCLAMCPPDCLPLWCDAPVVASGGRDGGVVLWDVRTGAQLQSLTQLHWTHARGLFGFGASEDRSGCKVKSVSFQATGLVSAGHDTSVLHTPWSAVISS
jgi:WD40 repeat protein